MRLKGIGLILLSMISLLLVESLPIQNTPLISPTSLNIILLDSSLPTTTTPSTISKTQIIADELFLNSSSHISLARIVQTSIDSLRLAISQNIIKAGIRLNTPDGYHWTWDSNGSYLPGSVPKVSSSIPVAVVISLPTNTISSSPIDLTTTTTYFPIPTSTIPAVVVKGAIGGGPPVVGSSYVQPKPWSSIVITRYAGTE